MDWRHKLLWTDGSAGALVGVLVLLLHGWLTDFYQLPRHIVLITGFANLAYGIYSLTLASRARRPMGFVIFLVIANSSWVVVCAVLTYLFWSSAGVFGLLHFMAEGAFVGGLAALEWRWRHLLATD